MKRRAMRLPTPTTGTSPAVRPAQAQKAATFCAAKAVPARAPVPLLPSAATQKAKVLILLSFPTDRCTAISSGFSVCISVWFAMARLIASACASPTGGSGCFVAV